MHKRLLLRSPGLFSQGIKRPGLPKRMHMRYRIAVHETGKALLATVLRRRYLEAGRKPHLEAVERVTILGRGRCVHSHLLTSGIRSFLWFCVQPPETGVGSDSESLFSMYRTEWTTLPKTAADGLRRQDLALPD